MADQQLTDYIKQRLAQGAQRMDISLELLRTGWQPTQVNEALTELNVSFDSTPHAAHAAAHAPSQASKAAASVEKQSSGVKWVWVVVALVVLAVLGGGYLYLSVFNGNLNNLMQSLPFHI